MDAVPYAPIANTVPSAERLTLYPLFSADNTPEISVILFTALPYVVMRVDGGGTTALTSDVIVDAVDVPVVVVHAT